MKKIFCLLMLVIFSTLMLHAQSVAINTDGSTPNASAMVDIKSTNKGMLIPRMTSAQRTAISSPASGLLVFDNTTESFWFYTTSGWIELISGGNQWTLNGANLANNNSGNVSIGSGLSSAKFNVNSSIGNTIANFNGSTNNSYMAFYENSNYLGYLGSYAGAANDIDFGTGGGNSGGKVHLTIQGNPKLTIDAIGNVGIGTTTPAAKLDIQGNANVNGEINRPSTGASNLVPIAFGTVAGTNILSGTGNFTVTSPGTGLYNITIASENYDWRYYTTVITAITSNTTVYTASGAGHLSITTSDLTGVAKGGSFHFVVYKQ